MLAVNNNNEAPVRNKANVVNWGLIIVHEKNPKNNNNIVAIA